jgi:hypothetical protein
MGLSKAGIRTECAQSLGLSTAAMNESLVLKGGTGATTLVSVPLDKELLRHASQDLREWQIS